MVIDRVTSLADLAFRGKTDKRFRHLAVLTTVYYGKKELTYKEAMAFLHEFAVNNDGGSCVNIVRDLNYNRELVKDDWVEPPEQLELTPQPQKKEIISYSEWLYDERDKWYGNSYRSNYDNYYYTTNT